MKLFIAKIIGWSFLILINIYLVVVAIANLIGKYYEAGGLVTPEKIRVILWVCPALFCLGVIGLIRTCLKRRK